MLPGRAGWLLGQGFGSPGEAQVPTQPGEQRNWQMSIMRFLMIFYDLSDSDMRKHASTWPTPEPAAAIPVARPSLQQKYWTLLIHRMLVVNTDIPD